MKCNFFTFLNKLKTWHLQVCRAYSLPLSFLAWLVAFCYSLQIELCNKTFGLLALIGILCSHIGTNIFDDVIDCFLKVKKQSCKIQYLENGNFSLKAITIGSLLYFGIAVSIGIFLYIKTSYIVLIITAIAAILCLIYPKINHIGLGELTVFLTFGPLLFLGVYYVMTNSINILPIFISIAPALLISVVLISHSLMDYDLDLQNKKYTLCIKLGSKKNALNLLFIHIILAYLITLLLCFLSIIPPLALATFISLPFAFRLRKNLHYICLKNQTITSDNFFTNFNDAVILASLYCIILSLSILFG